MDTKKFIMLISALTAVICALTVVYNFASMPAYGDTEVSAVALYTTTASQTSEAVPSSETVSSSSVSHTASSSSRVSLAASSTASSVTTTTKTSSVTEAASSTGKSSSKSSKSKTESKKTATTSNPVNLNTATAAQLETVPYIGVTRANAIIAYRNTHGAFKSINDLDNVKGFGKKMIAKVSPYLTLG